MNNIYYQQIKIKIFYGVYKNQRDLILQILLLIEKIIQVVKFKSLAPKCIQNLIVFLHMGWIDVNLVYVILEHHVLIK
jgi:hypothetical protein